MMQPTPNESHVPTDELVDIREVSVDKNLPKEERIAAFIRQIKNPYRFRCGDFVVNACFAGNGVTLEVLIDRLIDRIEVSHDKQITVRYRFQSEFETYAEVLEQCRNM